MLRLSILLISLVAVAAAQTRLFFPATTAAEVTVTQDAGWEFTTGFVSRKLANTKGSSAIGAGSTIGAWTSGQDALDRQYVSGPMNSGAVFTSGTTTVKLQLMAREFNNGDNTTSRMGVRIVDRAGTTVRATLLAVAQYGPATELVNNVSHRNKTFADGDTVGASYTTVAGDRIVVEVGYNDAAGSTPQGAAKWGENATDLPVDETQTTDGAGWVEFSNTITFEAPAGKLFTLVIGG